MAIPPPPLDGRDYTQLVADARALAAQRAPEWTDMTAGDPGVALLELFAFLTESLIYRVNRLPERMYVAFLNLIGVSLEAPSAAEVTLRFSLAAPAESPTRIPRGARVGSSAGGDSGPVFATVDDATIPAGQSSVDVRALACEQIDGELLGVSTGQPGQRLTLAKPPVIARANRRDEPVDARDLSVGVAVLPGEQADVRAGDTGFALWREVASFADAGADEQVYMIDRVSGELTFGPSARGADGSARTLGTVPTAGREIRAWYRRGGGAAGNVAPGSLSRLIDALGSVTVSNPEPATGGRDCEGVAEALVRGHRAGLRAGRAIRHRGGQPGQGDHPGAGVGARQARSRGGPAGAGAAGSDGRRRHHVDESADPGCQGSGRGRPGVPPRSGHRRRRVLGALQDSRGASHRADPPGRRPDRGA